jgi:hypothetical protein
VPASYGRGFRRRINRALWPLVALALLVFDLGISLAALSRMCVSWVWAG